MRTEIWKIKDGFSRYEISNLGVVKSIERDGINVYGFHQHFNEIIRKQVLNKDGYLTLRLSDDNSNYKDFQIHRLVAELFCEKPERCNIVNHKDGNKQKYWLL